MAFLAVIQKLFGSLVGLRKALACTVPWIATYVLVWKRIPIPGEYVTITIALVTLFVTGNVAIGYINAKAAGGGQ